MSGLIIDNFAGGGGASTGIEMALGRSPDVAINHDPEAVAMHLANHPETKHYCQNIWQADPVDVVKEAGGGPVDLAWFSPDCKHFSKAKGKAPVKRNIRDLAWVVVLWAERVRPNVIMLENVEEFKGWGPVDLDGNPYPEHKGETFDKWVKQLRKLGYRVQWKELKACDYGAPTIRKRLFMIARCDGEKIVWPEPTHGKEGSGLLPYRTAAECIDWSIPCPSIFERKRPLADNTMSRIARGIQKFVIDSDNPFIVNLTHHGRDRVESLEEPFKTITGANRGEKALVSPVISRIGQTGGKGLYSNDARTPLTTVPSKAEHLLITPHISRQFGQGTGRPVDGPAPTTMSNGGGKTALVSAHVAKHFGGMTGVGIDTPLPTTTTRGTQNQIVTSNLIKLRGTSTASATDEPLHTISAGGLHHGEVRAFLMKHYGTGGQLSDLNDPMHTLSTKARMGLVTVAGEEYQIVDIGMRMLSARELFRAQGFYEEYIIDPEFNGKPLTKTAQIRCCGNSVCPVIPDALIRANMGDRTRLGRVA